MVAKPFKGSDQFKRSKQRNVAGHQREESNLNDQIIYYLFQDTPELKINIVDPRQYELHMKDVKQQSNLTWKLS
jgi:hypothetical protein